MLGRLASDVVTTLGSGIGGPRALGYSFNDAGLPFKQTTYVSTAMTSVQNQVEDVYNGYGQLTQQYQATGGSVNTSTTPVVQYGYSQPSGANYSRLTSMTYPNGRVEDYGYNSGIDTTISRVSTIADDAGSSSGTVAAYTYLGLSTIVQEAEGDGVALTYIEQSGDSNALTDGGDRYTGLDRFGRVDDQFYLNTSTGAAVDRIQYGYDRDGNVLDANNLVNGSFSELYHANSTSSGDNNSAYDQLSRLTSFSRGTLTSSGNNGTTLDTITAGNLNSTSGVPNQNSWNLDALGNWNSSAPGGTSESNTFNSQNEETANGSNGLTYDNAGEMTRDELGNSYTFDAWGHVIATASATFQYDALGRNVITNSGNGNQPTFYDTAGRQVQVFLSYNRGLYTQNVWGLAYVNDLILRDRNADTSNSTGSLGLTGSGLEERVYAQHDSQFSVISLTSGSGTVLQRFVYDPYGKATVLTASWAATSDGYAWTTTFQGMTLVQDGSGNLLQSQTRLYDTNLGRWTSQDWAGYVDGGNRFEALVDSPTNKRDPFGLASIPYGPPTQPVDAPPQVDYGNVFSFYDPGFISNYVKHAQWGNTKFDTDDGNIHTFLQQLTLPSCVAPGDRPKLQPAVDAFNNAALEHEEEVERWFLAYLAGGGSGTDANVAAATHWGANSVAETNALIKLYSLLQKAFASCKCPNPKANKDIADELQTRINNLKNSLVFGPPAPKGLKP